jgi:hypothetical protein
LNRVTRRATRDFIHNHRPPSSRCCVGKQQNYCVCAHNKLERMQANHFHGNLSNALLIDLKREARDGRIIKSNICLGWLTQLLSVYILPSQKIIAWIEL